MRVLITRPREDAQRLTVVLAARGIEGVMASLLDIVYVDGAVLDLTGVQAVLMTSANGARAFAQRTQNRTLPVLCVGDASQAEALALGFTNATSAGGDVQALVNRVQDQLNPDGGVVLHSASSNIAGDLGRQLKLAGYSYHREVLYRAQKVEILPTKARQALESGDLDGVLLYSPRTAAAFASRVLEAGLEAALGTVKAYCLSSAVADKISALAWADVKIAKIPTQDALLVLL